MASKKPKFLRRTSSRYSKLGKGRKKKQIWRRPTGRHNKMRNKRNGYPVIVSIGYGTKKIGEERIIVNNVKDLEKVKENKFIILGKIGNKNKLEIVKKAKEMKIKFQNMDTEKFLKEFEKEQKKKAEAKKAKDKKAGKKDKVEKKTVEEKKEESKGKEKIAANADNKEKVESKKIATDSQDKSSKDKLTSRNNLEPKDEAKLNVSEDKNEIR